MRDGLREKVKIYLLSQSEYKTPLEIANAIGVDRSKIGSISSRIRDLELLKYGNYKKDIKKIGKDLYAYKLTAPNYTQSELFNEYETEKSHLHTEYRR